jgi:hypothetical protein
LARFGTRSKKSSAFKSEAESSHRKFIDRHARGQAWEGKRKGRARGHADPSGGIAARIAGGTDSVPIQSVTPPIPIL